MNEHGNNNRNRPISGRRRARCRLQGIALSVLCLFFAACAQTFPDGDVLERYPDGGVPIRLTVSLPQSAFLEKRTKVEKASDETENRIEEMRILVFERNESGYAYRYMVEAEQLQSSGTGVLFQAKLLSTPNPVKLMLVGNYGDAFAVYAPSPAIRKPMSKPERDVRSENPYGVCPCTVRSSFRPDWKPTGRTVTVSRCCVRQPGSMWRRTWRRIRGRYGSRASAYTARTTKSKSHPTKPSMRNPLGLLRRRYLREP